METKQKCNYPGCKKESKYRQLLELINEKDSSVELPFCNYHFYIVVGGHFKAKIIKESKHKIIDSKITTKKIAEKIASEELNQNGLIDFELIGPFKEIELTEQVMGAREMVAALTSQQQTNKLKNSNEDLNKK